MHWVLYTIWLAIPAFFFIMGLWSKLEQISNKSKKENPKDFFKQGLFVLGCAIICIVIDLYLLEHIEQFINSSWLPLGFLQAILFPLVLLAGGRLIGGSEEIRISKAPRSSRGKK